MAIAGYDIDIHELVKNQLPVKVLQRGWRFEIQTDPYHLQARVVFWMENDQTALRKIRFKVSPRRYGATLEREKLDGRWVACKLPDWFVSHLCTVPYHEEADAGAVD